MTCTSLYQPRRAIPSRWRWIKYLPGPQTTILRWTRVTPEQWCSTGAGEEPVLQSSQRRGGPGRHAGPGRHTEKQPLSYIASSQCWTPHAHMYLHFSSPLACSCTHSLANSCQCHCYHRLLPYAAIPGQWPSATEPLWSQLEDSPDVSSTSSWDHWRQCLLLLRDDSFWL